MALKPPGLVARYAPPTESAPLRATTQVQIIPASMIMLVESNITGQVSRTASSMPGLYILPTRTPTQP